MENIKFCANCGNKTQEGKNFCPKCGCKLSLPVNNFDQFKKGSPDKTHNAPNILWEDDKGQARVTFKPDTNQPYHIELGENSGATTVINSLSNVTQHQNSSKHMQKSSFFKNNIGLLQLLLDRYLFGDELKYSQLQDVKSFPIVGELILREGIDCDQLPSGSGPFGKSINNPIPVNGPRRNILY